MLLLAPFGRSAAINPCWNFKAAMGTWFDFSSLKDQEINKESYWANIVTVYKQGIVVRLLLTEKGSKGGRGEKGPQGIKGIPGRPGTAIFVDSGEEILTIKGEKVRLALLRI